MTFWGKTFKLQHLVHCGSFPSVLRFPDFLILGFGMPLHRVFKTHVCLSSVLSHLLILLLYLNLILALCLFCSIWVLLSTVYPWQVTVLAGLIEISRKVGFLLDHNADLFEPCANRELQTSCQWASTYWKSRDSRHVGCILSPLSFFLLIYCCYHSGLCCCWTSIPH